MGILLIAGLRLDGSAWDEVVPAQEAKHLDFVDIDAGHWPMLSKPVDLARILAAAAPED